MQIYPRFFCGNGILLFNLSIYAPFLEILTHSSRRPMVRLFDGFSHMLAKTMRDHVMMSFWGFLHIAPHLGSQIPTKTFS